MSASSQLPNPWYFDKSWRQYGLEQPVQSYIWEVLRAHPDGLDLQEVLCVLGREPLFCMVGRNRWMLSAYRPVRWGFAGTGLIAEDFVEALSLVPGAKLSVVAARSPDRIDAARKFAGSHGVQQVVADYRELAQRPDVDIVYVSNIHTLHKDTVLLMLDHGKHVLCEKPLAVNAEDTRAMIGRARERGLLFVAGLWSRHFPAIRMLRRLLRQGAIGEVQHFNGTFITRIGEDTQRLYDPHLGGGALLDIGIYPLAMANWVFGRHKPAEVQAMAVLAPTNVDVTGTVNLRYSPQQLATAAYSIALATVPVTGAVHGTKGAVRLHDKMHCTTRLTVEPAGEDEKPWHLDFPLPQRPSRIQHGPADGFNFGGSLGFVYQAIAVHSHVVRGLAEVGDVSNDEQIALMETCDAIRRQLGVAYPQDPPAQAAGASVAAGRDVSLLKDLAAVLREPQLQRLGLGLVSAMIVFSFLTACMFFSYASGKVAVYIVCMALSAVVTISALAVELRPKWSSMPCKVMGVEIRIAQNSALQPSTEVYILYERQPDE